MRLNVVLKFSISYCVGVGAKETEQNGEKSQGVQKLHCKSVDDVAHAPYTARRCAPVRPTRVGPDRRELLLF